MEPKKEFARLASTLQSLNGDGDKGRREEKCIKVSEIKLQNKKRKECTQCALAVSCVRTPAVSGAPLPVRARARAFCWTEEKRTIECLQT